MGIYINIKDPDTIRKYMSRLDEDADRKLDRVREGLEEEPHESLSSASWAFEAVAVKQLVQYVTKKMTRFLTMSLGTLTGSGVRS